LRPHIGLRGEEGSVGDPVGHPDSTGRLDSTGRPDVDALRRRIRDLEIENARLVETARLKNEIIAATSHEIRTPLNAIVGFTELMHDGRLGPISVEHREYLGDVLTSARTLMRLLSDVLDVAKIEAGRMEFHPEEIDATAALDEVRSILRGTAAKKRVRLEAHVDAASRRVVSDRAKLLQVLFNYGSNAIRATPAEREVWMRVLPDGHGFRIEVTDAGPGIDPKDVPNLFVEFHREGSDGAGLGLAVSRRIVEAQGGTVGVESTPGKGSTFRAVYPRVEPEKRS
jgi:signal transduction histidine kinase